MEGQYGINDVYLAVPTIINSTGVVRIVNPELKDEEELSKLQKSASVLKEHIQKVINK
jgi:L-lactate dehydrogenase